MKKLIALTFLPLLLAVLLGAAACGGDDDDTDGTDATATIESADDEEPTTDGAGEEPTEDDGDDEGDAPEGGTDLETYFVSLEEVVVSADQEQEAIGNELNQVAEDDPEYVTKYQDALHESGEKAELVLLELSEMDPPEEAADAHDDYVARLGEALAGLADFTEVVDEASSPADIEAAFTDFNDESIAANDATEGACLELQAIADDEAIEVDLECTI